MIKNKKNFFLIILIFILFIFSTSIYAYSSFANFAPKYGKTNSRVNFRSVSSTSSSIVVKVLAKGTSVKMVGTIDDFYIVQLGTNEVGAIAKKYVSNTSYAPKGASTYTMISKKTAYINGSNVNLRRGPGTNFKSITKLSNGTNVTIIGYISDWYLCITKTGYIGMVKENLLTFNKVSEAPKTTPTEVINTKGDTNEELVLKLINEARTKAGLKALQMDANILKIARLKANDMVNKEYFSHTSPTYGSPFAMMKNYSVSYKVAGENIAGNPSLEAAVNSWLNSATHKQNILSESYNLVGIGVAKSRVYGYIIVAMFVGR